jgi:DNA-binding NarL/FixJ family response regulator
MSEHKIRILVVDDHPVLRDGVAAILENQADMTMVGEARSGSEAIERFNALRPDVTLMDLQMPGRNGVDAIHDVHRGQRHVHRHIADEIALHVVDEPLSEREIAILRLVSIGKANKQIASELGLSEETVKGHLKSIFSKLDVADRTHAVTIAARRGIIEL